MFHRHHHLIRVDRQCDCGHQLQRECLDPGGFGSVTLTKSITIDCKETLGGVLAAGTNGIVINSVTAIVRLRGLDIDGAGTGLVGVRIISAAAVFVEDTVIDGFTQDAISVENSGDVKVVVRGSSLRNNNGAGVNGQPTGTADIVVSNSLLSGNGTGMSAGSAATFRISGNTIVYNSAGLVTHGRTGKIISYQNNTLDGNSTNGSPTSTSVLQ